MKAYLEVVELKVSDVVTSASNCPVAYDPNQTEPTECGDDF